VDIRKIKKLIELLEESSLTELEIVEGEESVRLMRGGQAQAMSFAPQQMMAAAPVAAALVVEPPKSE
jgi:acetyl-CoA carboxylase biotin carboxyl carrier protein